MAIRKNRKMQKGGRTWFEYFGLSTAQPSGGVADVNPKPNDQIRGPPPLTTYVKPLPLSGNAAPNVDSTGTLQNPAVVAEKKPNVVVVKNPGELDGKFRGGKSNRRNKKSKKLRRTRRH
jgi:hypothetical protein